MTQNIKDNNSKWKWKWESEWKWEWNDKNRDSGITALHESPDRDEKIKLLEDLAKEDESQKAEVLIKKQKEISKYDVENILESSWVSQVWIDTLNYIVRNYNEWIKEIVDFFLQELKKLDTLEIRNQFDAKKWKLDTHKVRKYVASDPTLGDIEKQKFYDKTEHIEKISEMLKKIDLTLAIDVSWSTNSFRWKDGMMNIISTILFIAMKHLEQHMKNMINDWNYTIPVHFVLYWDGNPYSSHSSVHKNDTDEVKMAEMNEKILTLDWGTNDTTAWQKISYEFWNFLKSNPEYVSEIKNQKRKPIILQIADSDVSENGVDILKETFSTYLQNDEIVNKIPIKRMILGNVSFDEITTEEYLERQKTWSLWNWEPLHLPNGKIQLKQVWVKQKKEIVWQIKALFANFFDDINYK